MKEAKPTYEIKSPLHQHTQEKKNVVTDNTQLMVPWLPTMFQAVAQSSSQLKKD